MKINLTYVSTLMLSCIFLSSCSDAGLGKNTNDTDVLLIEHLLLFPEKYDGRRVMFRAYLFDEPFLIDAKYNFSLYSQFEQGLMGNRVFSPVTGVYLKSTPNEYDYCLGEYVTVVGNFTHSKFHNYIIPEVVRGSIGLRQEIYSNSITFEDGSWRQNEGVVLKNCATGKNYKNN